MKKMMIEVRRLSHYYNGQPALRGINFSVFPGEIFGFLGPNGAGKTTTIKILTGQLHPTEGSAQVAGCDVVKDRQDLKPKIGVVFEVQNLYQRLSAWDNLVFTARLYGIPRKRVKQVLDQVGLSERAKDSPKKYSNGMKQRLLIARALLPSPQVLFLDEPTRGLDPNVARTIRRLVVELSQQGMTVFLTTHYMEEADQLCRRVAILDEGKIIAVDTPENLKSIHGNGQPVTLEDVFVRLTGRELDQSIRSM